MSATRKESQDRGRDASAERAVAGAMMVEPTAARLVVDRVQDPAAFSFPSYREVFLAIREMLGSDQPVDSATVYAQLRRRGTIDVVGGAAFLTSLVKDTYTVANVAAHLATLLERLKYRRLLAIAEKLQTADPETPAEELADSVRVWLDAAERGLSTAAVETEQEAYARALAERTAPVATGWADVDAVYMGGWWPGLVHVIAARTGNGKSTVLLNWATRAVDAGVPVDIHAWELGRVMFLDLLAAFALRKPKERHISRWRELTDEEKAEVRHAIDPYVDAGLHVYGPPDEHGGAGWPQADDVWSETDARVEWFERQVSDSSAKIIGCDLFESVVVMKHRPAEWDKAMVRARAIAYRHKRHLWLLHQINRQSGEPEDARPQLKHLKYSGALEEKAHIVTGVHYPGAYRRVKRETVEAEVLKQTLGGKLGTRLEWDADWATSTLRDCRTVDTRRPAREGRGGDAAMDGGQDEIDF